jgi:hypothetical protein
MRIDEALYGAARYEAEPRTVRLGEHRRLPASSAAPSRSRVGGLPFRKCRSLRLKEPASADSPRRKAHLPETPRPPIRLSILRRGPSWRRRCQDSPVWTPSRTRKRLRLEARRPPTEAAHPSYHRHRRDEDGFDRLIGSQSIFFRRGKSVSRGSSRLPDPPRRARRGRAREHGLMSPTGERSRCSPQRSPGRMGALATRRS